jgi:hypothetical protein
MRTFEAFSDHDFELFVAQLLRAEVGISFEVFARGADGGVDLRHSPAVGAPPDIVQCKHFLHSSFAQLLAAARREAAILPSLSPPPRSYRFVTTQALTPHRKTKLVQVLGGWVRTEGHILGRDDLELLLDRHPSVERQHAKLWLTGSGQLDRIIHAETYERSQRLLEETRAALSRYVETAAFFEARERLRTERALIIAGPPGIGKTTLARMLLADAVLDGYEPIEVSSDIDEANAVVDATKPQAFHYDDFLGTTFLRDRLRKNEDKRLASFFLRASRSDKQLLVLTTREYILQQAGALYEEFARLGLEARRYMLTLDSYSAVDRARIFYNHVWVSGQLTHEAKRSLLVDRGYRRIVNHQNYNPRLIEYITGLGARRLAPADMDGYLDFALSALDRPDLIWQHAFEEQLSATERALVISLASLPTRAALADVGLAFEAYAHAAKLPTHGNAVLKAVKVLNETFVESSAENSTVFLQPANPSIVDFISRWLLATPREMRTALDGALYFEQVQWLASLLISRRHATSSDDLLGDLATAIVRTFESAHPGWHRVREESDPDIRWSRQWADKLTRLIWITRTRAEDPHLQRELSQWLEGELHEQAGRWLNDDVYDADGPVSLLQAFPKDAMPEYLVAAAKTWAASASGWRSRYRWEQAPRLRELVPDIYSVEEWRQLGDEYRSWATGALFDPENDADDIRNLSFTAEEFDVALDDAEMSEAIEDAERRASERELPAYDDDDYRGRGSPFTRDSDAAIAAIFAHLE